MIGFMVAAFYMGWLWQTVEAEQNKAVALKLAAEGQLAENRHSNQLQLHALLAIESTKRYPSPRLPTKACATPWSLCRSP